MSGDILSKNALITMKKRATGAILLAELTGEEADQAVAQLECDNPYLPESANLLNLVDAAFQRCREQTILYLKQLQKDMRQNPAAYDDDRVDLDHKMQLLSEEQTEVTPEMMIKL
jgi:hypothetical protein